MHGHDWHCQHGSCRSQLLGKINKLAFNNKRPKKQKSKKMCWLCIGITGGIIVAHVVVVTILTK